MSHCFQQSLLTIVLLFIYLYLLDFIWLILPELSSFIILIGTIGLIVLSFFLAKETTKFIFKRKSYPVCMKASCEK